MVLSRRIQLGDELLAEADQFLHELSGYLKPTTKARGTIFDLFHWPRGWKQKTAWWLALHRKFDRRYEKSLTTGRLPKRIPEPRHLSGEPGAVGPGSRKWIETEHSMRSSFPGEVLDETTARDARDKARRATGRPHAGVPVRARAAIATGRSYFKGIRGDWVLQFETIAVTTPGKRAWQQQIQLRDMYEELENRRNTRLIDVVRKALQGDLALFCNCPYFHFFGAHFNLTRVGEIFGSPENRPPDVRDPRRQSSCCKHLFAGLQALPFFAPDIVQYIRAHPGALSARARRALADFERRIAQRRPGIRESELPAPKPLMERFEDD